MGVRRAQHIGVGLAQQIVVTLEPAVTTQQALVFKAPHRLSDSELAHYDPRSVMAGTPRSVEI